MTFERPCCADRNVCKSLLGSGIVNFPLALNWGINRIKPSGLHNNSDCSDKVAALAKDEADTAMATPIETAIKALMLLLSDFGFTAAPQLI